MEMAWSIVAAAYSLAGVASVGLSWEIARRAARGREMRLLLGSIIALALHYVAMSADAFARASGSIHTRFTVQQGAGDVFLVVFWGLACLFLFEVVKRLQAPQAIDGSSAWAVVGSVCAMSVVVLFLVGWLALDLILGAPPEQIQASLGRLTEGTGTLLYLGFFPASISIQKLNELPKQDREGWAKWFGAGAGDGQLTSLELAGYPPRVPENPISKATFMVLSGIQATGILLLIVFGLTRHIYHWTPFLVGVSALFRLLLLPSLLGLIYYQTRFTFFDVVLKRGVLFGLVALAITAVTFSAPETLFGFGTAPRRAAISVGATLFACASAGLF
ncbi:MAG: hypothetical protein M3Z85_01005, partial [Acidobacteriota bacterium]|nr:hypothetical protein [Acidobacteriota bacterium]